LLNIHVIYGPNCVPCLTPRRRPWLRYVSGATNRCRWSRCKKTVSNRPSAYLYTARCWSKNLFNLKTSKLHNGKRMCDLRRSNSTRLMGFARLRENSYELFFLRSAQRFFIISDSRFLPAAVRPPRLFLRELGACRGVVLRLARAAVPSIPSKAAMARSIRSLSLFNSPNIECMFKIGSLDSSAICILRSFYWTKITLRIVSAAVAFRNSKPVYKSYPIHRSASRNATPPPSIGRMKSEINPMFRTGDIGKVLRVGCTASQALWRCRLE